MEEIRNNYRKMDDLKIKSIAEKEARGLRADVISLLISEIQCRNLNPNLIDWINAERRQLSEWELKALKNKIANLPCPECGKRGNNLIGTIIREVVGLLITTSYEKKYQIICKDCAKIKTRKAILYNSIFGWWGLEGILYTPYAILSGLVDNFRKEKESDKIITDFILEKIGLITIGEESEETLWELIKAFNDSLAER